MKEKDEDREAYLRTVSNVARSYLEENKKLGERLEQLEKRTLSDENVKKVDELGKRLDALRKKKR